jgi:hypothetical protein
MKTKIEHKDPIRYPKVIQPMELKMKLDFSKQMRIAMKEVTQKLLQK